MIVKQIACGGDRNFAYIVACEETKEAALFDPSYTPAAIVQQARDLGFSVKYVCNTHGHPDHTNGNVEATQLTGAPLLAPRLDVSDADHPLDGGEEFPLGTLTLRVIFTPGHTPGSVMYLVTGPGEADQPPQLITGDTLFVGKVGGTDFSGSDPVAQHRTFFETIRRDVPLETQIWPGHDFGTAPTSTMEAEWETNPFLLREDYADFKWLKDNWARYKAEHGIA